MEKERTWLVSFITIVLPIVVGILSGFLADPMNNMQVYVNKPSFVPPAQVFSVVWTILYILMGIAFYLVINSKADSQVKKIATIVFLIQLAFNFFWPIVFFQFKLCKIAVLIICILLFLIVINIIVFYRIQKKAGYLLIPYLLWVLFALYLNIQFCALN